MQVTTTIPGLTEANRIMADVKRLGIQDVELMFDSQIQMWAVCQVFKPSGHILLMNTSASESTKPIIMFWIKTLEGTYRTPNEQDLSDIITITQRAQVTFDKGSDWMIDQMEAEEKVKYDYNRRKQSERILSYAKPLKKAIRKELG